MGKFMPGQTLVFETTSHNYCQNLCFLCQSPNTCSNAFFLIVSNKFPRGNGKWKHKLGLKQNSPPELLEYYITWTIYIRKSGV